jgi:DNA-binding LacI/PurR family transcriptional regulator
VRGWRDCLISAGRPTSDEWIHYGDWRASSGEAGLTALMVAKPEIDAIFVANDEMALGVLRAAHRLGKRIPEDLAVVGYDNMPEVPYFWPALTSVRPRLLEVGKLAIQTLHGIVEAKRNNYEIATPEVQTLSPELIVRESTVGVLAAVR